MARKILYVYVFGAKNNVSSFIWREKSLVALRDKRTMYPSGYRCRVFTPRGSGVYISCCRYAMVRFKEERLRRARSLCFVHETTTYRSVGLQIPKTRTSLRVEQVEAWGAAPFFSFRRFTRAFFRNCNVKIGRRPPASKIAARALSLKKFLARAARSALDLYIYQAGIFSTTLNKNGPLFPSPHTSPHSAPFPHLYVFKFSNFRM